MNNVPSVVDKRKWYNRPSRVSRACLHARDRDEKGFTAQQYLSEFSLFDGDTHTTFNLVDINTVKNEITVAVSREGKISLCTFDLLSNDKGLFFEYGVSYEKIAVDDFEQIEED